MPRWRRRTSDLLRYRLWPFHLAVGIMYSFATLCTQNKFLTPNRIKILDTIPLTAIPKGDNVKFSIVLRSSSTLALSGVAPFFNGLISMLNFLFSLSSSAKTKKLKLHTPKATKLPTNCFQSCQDSPESESESELKLLLSFSHVCLGRMEYPSSSISAVGVSDLWLSSFSSLMNPTNRNDQFN